MLLLLLRLETVASTKIIWNCEHKIKLATASSLLHLPTCTCRLRGSSSHPTQQVPWSFIFLLHCWWFVACCVSLAQGELQQEAQQSLATAVVETWMKNKNPALISSTHLTRLPLCFSKRLQESFRAGTEQHVASTSCHSQQGMLSSKVSQATQTAHAGSSGAAALQQQQASALAYLVA